MSEQRKEGMSMGKACRIINAVAKADSFGVSMALDTYCVDKARDLWAVSVEVNGQAQPHYVAYSYVDVRCIARAAQCHVLSPQRAEP